MEIRQARNFADHADVTEALDRLAIFAVLIPDQDDPVHLQFRRVQRRQRKQRVIHRTETAARSQDDGELQFYHQIEHELLLIHGHEHSAGAFDNEPVIVHD